MTDAQPSSDRPSIGLSHIALFVPSLAGGGAERVVVTLANTLSAMGHRVDLVAANAAGPYLGEISNDVHLVDLQQPRVLGSLPALVRYLKREQPQAMLSVLNHANIIAIIARIIARSSVRLVVSVRTSLAGSRAPNFKTAVVKFLVRFAYPHADGVISVSQGIARELTDQYGIGTEKVVAIPNPVDDGRIRELARQRPQHPWLAHGSPPVVLAVGRLSPQKDHLMLLDAFARLRQQRDARLVILGEGELRSDLERRIAELGLNDSVALPGFVPNPFGWMASCAVYALSSRFEGLPNTLLQAMACGAKVVSTDCPTGPREILEDGRWGRLVPVGDADELACSLASALADDNPPDTALRIRDFSVAAIVERYEEEILARGRTAPSW